MKYETIKILNTYGFFDLYQDISSQKLRLSEWKKVKKYLSHKQYSELYDLLQAGINQFNKNGWEIKDTTIQIYREVDNYINNLPF
ncbi:MAG: hypothetical protein KBA86_09210 [Bacteroidales bacterium]|nr:hypothetical protein [Bacteroidales bacterium]